MEISKLLSRAWQITWNHKILWIFGILAGLGGGGGGRFNFNWGGGGGDGGRTPTPTPPGGAPPAIPAPFNQPEWQAALVVIACIAIAIAIILFVLGIIGRGGLIGGIDLANERGAVTFGEAWGIGTRYFLRLFGIGLVLIIPVFLLACFAASAVVLTAGAGVFCVVPLICLMILVLIPLGIIAHFAQFAVVLENMGVMDALRRGWAILKANLVNIIILGIIVSAINFVIGLILAIPFILIAVPVAASFLVGRGEPNMGLLAVAGLCFVCYLPVLIVLSGILETWAMGVWTLVYRQFAGNTPSTSASMPVTTPPTLPA